MSGGGKKVVIYVMGTLNNILHIFFHHDYKVIPCMQINYFKYTFHAYFYTELHEILFSNHKAADSSLGQTNNLYC